MNKENTYFNAMRETVEAHRRDSTKPFPYTQGAFKAYRAWAASVSRGNEEPELDDFLWEREVSDFIATLRAAGIESFTITDRRQKYGADGEPPRLCRRGLHNGRPLHGRTH